MISGALGPECRSIDSAAGYKLLKLGKVSDGDVENWSFSHHCREDLGILVPRTIEDPERASSGFILPWTNGGIRPQLLGPWTARREAHAFGRRCGRYYTCTPPNKYHRISHGSDDTNIA